MGKWKRIIITTISLLLLISTISFAEIQLIEEVNIQTLKGLDEDYNFIKNARDIQFNSDGDIIAIKIAEFNQYFKVSHKAIEDKDLTIEIEDIQNRIDNETNANQYPLG